VCDLALCVTFLSAPFPWAYNMKGKILIIGGGIANFTNVAATFKVNRRQYSALTSIQGIVRALNEYHHTLIAHKIKIYVRRGGPNYQEGLRHMRDVGGFGG